MTVTTAKWTLDDYHRMIEVGLLAGRHELSGMQNQLLSPKQVQNYSLI